MKTNKKKVFLIISCLLNIAGIWMALVMQMRHDFTQTKVSAETNILNLTKAFEEHVNSSVKDIDRLLLNLRFEFSEGFDHFKAETKQIKDFGYSNTLSNISIINKDGSLLFAETRPAISEFELTDSKELIRTVEIKADSLFISKPLFSSKTKNWCIQFSRKLFDKKGTFVGIIVISVTPSLFSDFFQSVDIGSKGAVTLFGTDGYILARASGIKNIESATGMSIAADHPFIKKKSLTGMYTANSAVDGIARLSSFRKLQNYPLVAQVGLAEDDVFIHSSNLKRNILIIGTIISAALLGALSILLSFETKQQKLLEEVSQRDSQLQATLTELEHLVTTDSLTGLPNRRSFFSRAHIEFTRANRYERPLSLIMIDVDHFKDVNDKYGHLVGDAALRHISEIMKICVRESDMVARYGGEEFVIILPETDLLGSSFIAERVRTEIEASRMKVAQEIELKLTVSMGIACMTPDNQYPDIDKLLQESDDAMYKSKINGRNCISMAGIYQS